MADQIKKLSAGHSIEVLDAIMTEVEEARGEYESLDARLDEISGEGYSKAEADALLALKQNALNSAQLAAANSGINSEKVAQIETNKNNISKDDAALVELVDSGAKNGLQVDEIGVSAMHGQTYTINGVTFTLNSDSSITATRSETSTANADCNLRFNGDNFYVDNFCNGKYILSGCPAGGGATTYLIRANSQGSYAGTDYGEGVLLENTSAQNIFVTMRVTKDFTGTVTFKPMICTKAAWDISHEYQPYRPSYQELYEMVKALQANQ